MFRILVFGMVFWVGAVALQGEAVVGTEEKLIPRFYQVPPGFFSEPSELKPHWPAVQPHDGVQLILLHKEDSPPFFETYDVKSWFEALGLVFPKGSEAIYTQKGGAVFVRNTAENLKLIEQLGGCRPGHVAPSIVHSRISLVSFDLPKGSYLTRTSKLADLKKLAADSWKEISHLEIVSKPGQSATGSVGGVQEMEGGKNDPGHPFAAPTLVQNAQGSSAMIETVVGPDGWTVDSRISFRFRGDVEKTGPPVEITFDGRTTLWDGYPQVLQIIESNDGRPAYALILRVTLGMPNSWPTQNKQRTSP